MMMNFHPKFEETIVVYEFLLDKVYGKNSYSHLTERLN